MTGRPETPITLNGKTVADLVPPGLPPRLDRRSEAFLARTVQAIGWATLGATVLAVLMGLLASRTLLTPLRELLDRIRAMQWGEAPAPLGRVRSDEFGEVLLALGGADVAVAVRALSSRIFIVTGFQRGAERPRYAAPRGVQSPPTVAPGRLQFHALSSKPAAPQRELSLPPGFGSFACQREGVVED